MVTACVAQDPEEIVSKTASFKWTRRASSNMFNVGNLFRVISTIVLFFHACQYIEKGKTQPALLIFAVLNLFDIWSRYFLSVREPTQKHTVIVFAAIWSVMVGLYAVPLYGWYMSAAITFLLLIILIALVLTTTPVFNCKK